MSVAGCIPDRCGAHCGPLWATETQQANRVPVGGSISPQSNTTIKDRRDRAITACCLAAAAITDTELDGVQQGRLLMDCLGVLRGAYSGPGAPDMARFRRSLHGRLGDLLPADIAVGSLADYELLTADGDLNDEVLDLCAEHAVPEAALTDHWSYARVSAEQQERAVFEVLRRMMAGEYTRGRRKLIQHTTGELSKLRRVWDGLMTHLDFYEAVQDWTWCQIRGFWFPCPTCRWPMRVAYRGPVIDVRCEAHRRDGVSYVSDPADTAAKPRLTPAGHRAAPVSAKPVTPETRALNRAVWHYMALPGLLEITLESAAKAAGARVTMWPEKDLFDLRVRGAGRDWKIDVKAWASPMALADALAAQAPSVAGLIIVIPDHQQSALSLLRQRLGPRGYRVETITRISSEITTALQGQRGGTARP